MNDDVVIRAEGLGKKYVIGHEAERERYTMLRDVIGRKAKAILRTTSDMMRGRGMVAGDTTEDIWALKDVNFEVKRGEVLGIIGRNGAGKSTLLKILSRITEPTEGSIEIRGRVASLLEVGTGFHPELTGRENVYLNGAILGMSRAEIRRKFEEIVAFAEVEKFVDTPVKRYSSGMYVRLAFAVAAYLESEILLVDEVLAVGDTEFQKKCLGKMSDVASGGRTVLFVSHNLEAIARICRTGMLLSSGQVAMCSEIGQCVAHYSSKFGAQQTSHLIKFDKGSPERHHLLRIEIRDKAGNPYQNPCTWDHVTFRIFFYSPSEVRNGSVVLYISTASGILLTLCSSSPDSQLSMSFRVGVNFVDCEFPRLPLSAGSFLIGAGIAVPNIEWLDNQPHAAVLEVGSRDIFGSGRAPSANRYPVPFEHYWRIPSSADTLKELGDRIGQSRK
jgi:lipopolysaccharide transport system ATP-binding protein